MIRKLPSATRKILNDMKSYSENIMKMAVEHREKFDGTDGIPLPNEGKIHYTPG